MREAEDTMGACRKMRHGQRENRLPTIGVWSGGSVWAGRFKVGSFWTGSVLAQRWPTFPSFVLQSRLWSDGEASTQNKQPINTLSYASLRCSRHSAAMDAYVQRRLCGPIRDSMELCPVH